MHTAETRDPAEPSHSADRFDATDKRHAQSGFTLLEVVIAMLLLLIGMTGVALAQIQALRSGASSGARSKALYLAESQLEAFQAMATNDPNVTLPGLVQDPNNPISLDQNGIDLTQYFRCWVVTPNDPTVGGLTRITVEVRVGSNTCNAAAPAYPITNAARITGIK